MTPEGTLAPVGTAGELCVRSDGALLAYIGGSEDAGELRKFGDDWVTTGDVAEIDEDGFVTFVDRTRDIIFSGGANIYSTEVENVIYQMSGIEECAVFDIPDSRLGEVTAAHVVGRAGSNFSTQEVIEFCSDQLSPFKVPIVVEIVESLPKSAVGKIRKNVLRERYQSWS